MFKKIIISILIFLAFLYSLIPNPYTLVHAARPTEVTYPEIPGAIRPVTIKTALPEYIRYAFNFFVVISGLVCFATLIYGGITYLTSAGSPGRQKDATSQIAAAFLGIFIIFSAYLISKTINPQLVIPHAGIEAIGGVVLGTGGCAGDEPGGETKTFTQNAPNLGKMEDGTTDFVARSLKFKSRPGELEIILYDLENHDGNRLRISSDIQDCYNCGERRSIKFFWHIPGIYLCTGTYDAEKRCQGEEKYLGADTALLEPDFNDKVKAIKLRPAYATEPMPGAQHECEILNGRYWERDGIEYCTFPIQYFGAVLHEHADFTGKCEAFQGSGYEFVKNLSESETIGENTTSSVTVFAEPVGPFSGGVWLCEDVNPGRPVQKPDGSWENPSGCYGPYQLEHVEFIGNIDGNPDDHPNDKISSIIIDGEYISILFEDEDYKKRCEVFTGSDSNFRDNPIGRCGCIMGNWGCSDCLSSFIILPTKQ